MPPIAPAMPPMPTTEPTARLGNRSDESVKRFADQPWCAAAARLTMPTATHICCVHAAKTTGTTHNAHPSIAVLRPALTLQPHLMSRPDNQPPPTLPTSATR